MKNDINFTVPEVLEGIPPLEKINLVVEPKRNPLELGITLLFSSFSS